MSQGRAPPGDGGGRPRRPADPAEGGESTPPPPPRRDAAAGPTGPRPGAPGRVPEAPRGRPAREPLPPDELEDALDALEAAADAPDEASDGAPSDEAEPVLGHFEAAVLEGSAGRERSADASGDDPLLDLDDASDGAPGAARPPRPRRDRDVFETLHGHLEARLDALEADDGPEAGEAEGAAGDADAGGEDPGAGRTDEPADDDAYDEDADDPLDAQHDALEARLGALEAEEAAEGDDDGVLARFEGPTAPAGPAPEPRAEREALDRARRAAERLTGTPPGGVPRPAPSAAPGRRAPPPPLERPAAARPDAGAGKAPDAGRPTRALDAARPTRAFEPQGADDAAPRVDAERPTRLDLRAEAVRSPAPRAPAPAGAGPAPGASGSAPRGPTGPAARAAPGPAAAPPPRRPASSPAERGATARLAHQPQPPEGDDEATIARVTLALAPPQREDVERSLERARTTVGRMERLGFPTDPLEGRLAAAGVMLARDELQAALHLCQEVLVLARTMLEVGPVAGPRDTLPERVRALFEALLEGEAFGQAVNARTGRIVAQVLEDTLAGPTFQSAVSRLLERRLEAQLEEEAFARAVRALLERRLEALLPSDPFRRAAAAGAAAFPDDLLERPEVRARLDATIHRRERDLLASGRFADRVRALVLERSRELTAELAERLGRELPARLGADLLADPRLAALADARVDEKLRGFLDTPAAQAALEARGQAWATQAATSPLLAEAIEARVRARVGEVLEGELFLAGLDARTLTVLQSPEARLHLEAFVRGSQALGEAVDERLERSEAFQRRMGEQLVSRLSELVPRLVQDLVEQGVARHRHDLLEDGAFISKVDEVARKRAEALVEAAGFKAAIDARVRALAEDVARRIAGDVDQRVAAVTSDVATAAAERVLESPALKARIDAAAARATEGDHQRLTQRLGRFDEQREALERKLESLVPVLVKTALAEGGPVEGRLRALAEEAAKGALDEAFVVRVIQKELTNREALRMARLGGEGTAGDPLTALLKSDAVRQLIAEEVDAHRRKSLEKRAARETSKLRQAEAPGGVPPGRERAERAELDTQHERRKRADLDTAPDAPPPRRKPPPPEVPRPPRRPE